MEQGNSSLQNHRGEVLTMNCAENSNKDIEETISTKVFTPTNMRVLSLGGKIRKVDILLTGSDYFMTENWDNVKDSFYLFTAKCFHLENNDR